MSARLAIFETFKTKKEELTGEAVRQRSIIITLATQNNPTDMTRTAIAQKIAQKNNTVWKNIYSGIFRDLDEILIPLEIVEEAGRLPLRRGPKALQEKGIPFYQLTLKGQLVAISLDELTDREKILESFIKTAKISDEFGEEIRILSKFVPSFAYYMFRNYVKAFCDGGLTDLLPLEKSKFLQFSEESISIQKEFLESFVSMSKQEKERTLSFLQGV
jgi:hypothetical protein